MTPSATSSSGEAGMEPLPSQQYSHIQIGGDSRVQLGNTYYQSDDFHVILDRLAPPDQAARLRQIREQRQSGSADWFLRDERYVRWRDEGGPSLWCSGVPGAGKTFVMSAVVDDLEPRTSDGHIAVAFFFCNFQQQEHQTVAKILESLSRQLLQQNPALIDVAKRYLESCSAFGSVTAFDMISQILRRFRQTYLVIDALDEYSPRLEERLRLGATLADLATNAPPEHTCRLCISSRADAEAQRTLHSPAVITMRPNADTIRAYLVETIQRSLSLSRIPETLDLYHEIVDAVEQKSDRIFKLAALQMQFLENLTSRAAIKGALSNLSTQFDDYYYQALERIRAKPVLDERIFILLAWIVFGKRPLSIPQLRQCLALRADSGPGTVLEDLDEHVERLIAESEGLIEKKFDRAWLLFALRDDSQIATVAHETIAAYLRANTDYWLPFGLDKDLFIFSSCCRFLSIAACVEIVIQQTLSGINKRKMWLEWYDFYESGHAFLAWCLGQVFRFYPEDQGHQRQVLDVLSQLATQLTTQASSTGLDPLHVCAFFGWHFLCDILITQGAQPRARYDGLTPAKVAFAAEHDWVGMHLRYKESECMTSADFASDAYYSDSRDSGRPRGYHVLEQSD